MSAAEMMRVHSPSISNINSMGLRRTAPTPGSNTSGVGRSNNNNFSMFAPQAPRRRNLNYGRQLLQSEMTEEEDSELASPFLGILPRDCRLRRKKMKRDVPPGSQIPYPTISR